VEIEQPTVRAHDELRRLTGIKWTRHPADVLPAWVADMDLPPPDFARQAVQALVDRGDFGYNVDAAERLPEAFAQWQQRHHGWSPPPDEVSVFDDVLQAISVALWLTTSPGDGVVLLTPIYPPFTKAVVEGARRVVDVPLDPDGWRLDPDRLSAAIDDRTSAVLVCNPHNPTGRVFDEQEREALARVVVDNDLLLISDEVWGDLTHPGHQHVPMATLGPEVAARTITVSSASKAFNLAGLRCAAAHIGSKPLARSLAALPLHFLGAVASPGAEAALACWTEGDDWLAATRSFLTDRRDQLAKRLAAELPSIGFQPPEATYLAWLDCTALELDDEPREWFYHHAKVALSPGPDFGPKGRGYVRVNTATSADLVDEIIDRMVSALTAR
jgi:cystathionine beta-lyase